MLAFKIVESLHCIRKEIETDDKTKYGTSCSNSKAETIINESGIDDVFETMYTTVISNIQNVLEKASGCIVDFKVYSLRWRQLLKLLKELVHQKIELTNIQNVDDNECFKWCLVRYLHPADHKPRRITKANRNFAKKIDFKDIKFPVKLEICKKLKKKKKFYWH